MRVYLAGPMRGIPYFNFPAFHAAAAKLRAEGHEVFSPAELDESMHDKEFSTSNPTGDLVKAARDYGFDLRYVLARDLEYICLKADAVVLLPGWEKSQGATAERAVAIALGLKVVEFK